MVVGAVLAGGASRRMGRDKAWIEIDGEPLVGRAARVLREAGVDEVVVVGGDAAAVRRAGLEYVVDERPGHGPLGGVLTALRHAADRSARHVAVVACDLARLDAATVGSLLDAMGPDVAVAAAHTGRIEPLCAVWSVDRSLGAVADAVERGERAVHVVLADLGVTSVAVDPAVLHNANRPEDLTDL